MDRQRISAVPREENGTIAARKLRAAGQIPAVLYGRGREPVNIAIDAAEAKVTLAGGGYHTHIFDLQIENGSETVPVMIKEVQRHPIQRHLLNVDFHAISLTEIVHAQVPLLLQGEPLGLKRGGVLERLHTEVTLACLPTAIPENIPVDISVLEIGSSIHARDLTIPEGVELFSNPDEVLVILAAPAKPIEEVAAPAEEGAEPEVIQKGGAAEGE